jgi:hypothetical protein
MTHEQLQAAQRAALSLGLNIKSEQAAAIINAALRMEQEADPVAYVLFRDGEVFYETEDNIVISNKPGDSSDLYQWLPVYTAAAALKPDELTHCACGDAYPATSYGAGFIDGSGMCPNCDAAIPATDIHTPAARDVLAERRRQVETEGWMPVHDDEHAGGELADAAACYSLWAGGINPGNWREFWPWASEWLKHSEPRRMLVKAGALILAEIERLDRAANKEASHG